MEPIYMQLQALKQLYQSASKEELENPNHPIWKLYDQLTSLQ